MTSDPIVLVGAGNMGGALLRGWLASGIDAAGVETIDPSPSPAIQNLIAEKGVAHHPAAPANMQASALCIALKPQMMGAVLPTLKPLIGPHTLCISVAAGTPLATLSRHLGAAPMVRAMPNTPAMIGRGITAALTNGKVSEVQHTLAQRLLSVCGPVEWVDTEDEIDAVTALSGSGPAYVFYVTECMAEAGRKAGLDADLAMRLARATVAGAGELMHRSEEDAAILRKNVTSPGGTTAAALDVMMRDNGLKAIFEEAIAAAKRRAHELAEHG
ncbi:MAG: pyrroline-5-carboxylate reductase [Pseudomonadota bacterium]